MRVLETFVRSKCGDPELGDDVLFLGEHFAAVIDGVSASGERSGRIAAELVAGALEQLRPAASVREAFDLISNTVDAGLRASELHEPRF